MHENFNETEPCFYCNFFFMFYLHGICVDKRTTTIHIRTFLAQISKGKTTSVLQGIVRTPDENDTQQSFTHSL